MAKTTTHGGQKRLSQIVAAEAQIKKKVNSEGSELHKRMQKAENFTGLVRNYKKFDDEGEDLPSETKKLQFTAPELFAQFAELMGSGIDAAFARDYANCNAFADIKIGDKVLAEKVPVSHLIWLEKQMDDFNTVAKELPTLDPSKEWFSSATQTGAWHSEPLVTSRSKKVVKPLVLYPATDKHPAQVKEHTEDIVVGTWTATHLSGAITEDDKKALLSRITTLKTAIKEAREEANAQFAEVPSISPALNTFILGDLSS